MKKSTLSLVFTIFSLAIFAQQDSKPISLMRVLIPIEGDNNSLTINKTHQLFIGDSVQIYLPATQKFLFIKQKHTDKTVFNLKAPKLKYSPSAIENIDALSISKSAKKIAGKKAEVLDWKLNKEDGYILDISIENKEYEVYLNNAIWANEIRVVK